MCDDRNFFKTLNHKQKGQIILADGQKLSSAGIGDGFLYNNQNGGNCQKIKLLNVLYVPQLNGNLISVKKLTGRGLEVLFKNDTCHIMKENKIVAEATEVNGLYELNTTQKALKASASANCASATSLKASASAICASASATSAKASAICASAKHTECIHYWHNRLGHRDPNAIKAIENMMLQ